MVVDWVLAADCVLLDHDVLELDPDVPDLDLDDDALVLEDDDPGVRLVEVLRDLQDDELRELDENELRDCPVEDDEVDCLQPSVG